MPDLSEIIKNRNEKKFIKKNYRPWDLSGNPIPYEQNTDPAPSNIQSYPNSFDNEEKETTIHLKIDNGLDNSQVTYKEPLVNKAVTIEKQKDNIGNTKKVTVREQLDNNLDPTSLHNRIMNLSGLQRQILEFIIDICSIREDLETGPIETTTISEYIKSSTGSVKTSINRLIDKGFLLRNKGRTARGGYINLSITESIFNIVREQREKYQRFLNPAQVVATIKQQLDNKSVYSSNSLLENTTTKYKENFPKEWETINYEILSEIGFTKTQIKQLIDKSDPMVVQESINHFAFGLQHNQKLKKYDDPLNVLMGVLRKGQAWFEKDYRSPTEIAQQQLLEHKKAEIERKKHLAEEAYKLALQDWLDRLTPEEIEEIAPKKAKGDLTPQLARLGIHFKENLWPKEKKAYLLIEG